jgi:hypothetical protein
MIFLSKLSGEFNMTYAKLPLPLIWLLMSVKASLMSLNPVLTPNKFGAVEIALTTTPFV